jgi:hypothetical protein
MYPVCLSSAASAIAGAAWGGLAVALVVQKIRNIRRTEDKGPRPIASKADPVVSAEVLLHPRSAADPRDGVPPGR